MQTLTLEPHEITTILKALSKLPYEEVVGLITKITYQASIRKEDANERIKPDHS